MRFLITLFIGAITIGAVAQDTTNIISRYDGLEEWLAEMKGLQEQAAQGDFTALQERFSELRKQAAEGEDNPFPRFLANVGQGRGLTVYASVEESCVIYQGQILEYRFDYEEPLQDIKFVEYVFESIQEATSVPLEFDNNYLCTRIVNTAAIKKYQENYPRTLFTEDLMAKLDDTTFTDKQRNRLRYLNDPTRIHQLGGACGYAGSPTDAVATAMRIADQQRWVWLLNSPNAAARTMAAYLLTEKKSDFRTRDDYLVNLSSVTLKEKVPVSSCSGCTVREFAKPAVAWGRINYRFYNRW